MIGNMVLTGICEYAFESRFSCSCLICFHLCSRLNTKLSLPDFSLQGGLGCLIHTKCRVEKPKHCVAMWSGERTVLCCSHMSAEETLLCAA